MTVQRYRRKPEHVHAVQWRGDNADELASFLGGNFERDAEHAGAWVWERGDWRPLLDGDWITRDARGAAARFRPQDFAAQFEPDESVRAATVIWAGESRQVSFGPTDFVCDLAAAACDAFNLSASTRERVGLFDGGGVELDEEGPLTSLLEPLVLRDRIVRA